MEGANWAPLLSRLDEFLSSGAAGAEQRILDELPRAIPARRAGLTLPPSEERSVRRLLADRMVGPVEIPPKNLLVAVAGDRLLWLEDAVERQWSASEQVLVRHVAAVLSARDNPDSASVLERVRVTARVCSRVAHDFDNILTGVIGFAELALPMLSGSVAKQYIAELLRVGQQGVDLTRRLHQLGREVPVQTRPTPLATAWRAVEGPLRAGLPAGVTLDVALPESLPEVAVEPESLRMILEPILANAAEAAPKAPIAISAMSVELNGQDSGRVLGNPLPGRYVALTVADRGPGIAPEVRRRLLVEPCFSTKSRHRGLGLAYTFRLLHAHGGGFVLEPGAAGGTAARLYLPTPT